MDKSFVVAIISLTGTILTVLVANAVSAWSKWLDVKQKANDHKMLLRATYLISKIKAAENAISKWTVALSYYNALEQYTKGMNPNAPLAEELSVPMEAQLIKLSDALSSAFSEGTAFLLYFEVDDNFWSSDISDLLFARYARISALMNELKSIAEYLDKHPDMIEEDRKGIIQEEDFRMEELLNILQEIPAIVKAAKDRLMSFVKNINHQLKEYENLN